MGRGEVSLEEKLFELQKQIYVRFPLPFRLKPPLNQGATMSVLDPNPNLSRQAQLKKNHWDCCWGTIQKSKDRAYPFIRKQREILNMYEDGQELSKAPTPLLGKTKGISFKSPWCAHETQALIVRETYDINHFQISLSSFERRDFLLFFFFNVNKQCCLRLDCQGQKARKKKAEMPQNWRTLTCFQSRHSGGEGNAVVLPQTLQALLYGAAEESNGPTGLNMQTAPD